MATPSLRGSTILVVEDEPLIAAGVADALQGAGALVRMAHRTTDALRHVEELDIDVAVLDWALGDSDVKPVCERLDQLGTPFVIYSGFPKEAAAGVSGVFVAKPVSSEYLIRVVANLLNERVG